jgi:hypothetical protein
MFTYFALSAPGSANDRVAIKEEQEEGSSLHDLIERLPLRYVIIGDAAYKPTEHLASIFYGNVRANSLNDNFNYYASQCRIRIEMAFGLMTAKWGILHRPLQQKLGNIKHIAYSIARLHNYCIRERITMGASEWDQKSIEDYPYDATVPNLPGLGPEFPMGERENQLMYRHSGYSCVRYMMANRIRDLNLTRPSTSVLYRRGIGF